MGVGEGGCSSAVLCSQESSTVACFDTKALLPNNLSSCLEPKVGGQGSDITCSDLLKLTLSYQQLSPKLVK